MTWLAWRQYRMGLLSILAMLAAATAFLLPTGLHGFSVLHDSGLAACISAGQSCRDLHGPLELTYNSWSPIVGWFHLVPVVVGVLLAAPVISDLESRTFRLAWTQSITRERWLVTKLGVALVAIVVFALIFTAVMTWWYAPMDRTEMLPKTAVGQSFDYEGVMPFCYAIFAFAVALASGAVTRRMLAAPLVALVSFIVLLLALQNGLQDTEMHVQAIAPPNALRDMSHFWTVQGVEAAIFLSSAAVLIGLTVWLVGRRP